MQLDAKSQASYFTYDVLNRRIASEDALGRDTYYEYDEVGNTKQHIDANNAPTYYAYDALYMPISVLHGNDTKTYFEYDPVGNRIKMIDGWGETHWGYDALDREISRTQPGDENTYYEYDQENNRTVLIDPDGGITYYEYDCRNLMIQAVSPDNKVSYYDFDEIGQQTKKILGNNSVVYYSYDNVNKLAKLENVKSDLTAVSTFDYTRDRDGNITKVLRGDGDTIYYNYDALHRLTECDWRDSGLQQVYSFEYNYDEVGNRTSLVKDGTATYYNYDAANELLDETTGATITYYEWDNNGNLKSSKVDLDVTYYEWTPRNMVSQIIFPDLSGNYYSYDGDQTRIRKQDSTGTIYYTSDDSSVILEKDADQITIAQYTHGYIPVGEVGSLAVTKRGESYQFLFMDDIGSIRELSDDAETVIQYYEYSPFGCSLLEVGNATNFYRFSSMELDSDSRLYHFIAGVWNPKQGRFLSMDLPWDSEDQYQTPFAYISNEEWIRSKSKPPPKEIETGECGKVVVKRKFKEADKQCVKKQAICLVKKLVPNNETVKKLIPKIPYNILYVASLEKCNGLTWSRSRFPGSQVYIFIHEELIKCRGCQRPVSPVTIAELGATALHETYHYTGMSSCDKIEREVDNPIADAAVKAGQRWWTGCCDLCKECIPIASLLRRYACNCEIYYARGKKGRCQQHRG